VEIGGVQKDSLVPVQPVPADALVFKFPRGLAWFMFGVACISFGFMIFVLAMQTLKPSHGSLVIALLGVAMCGLFATLTLRSFSRLRDSVAVSSEGIWYLPRKGEPTFIAWFDVASVKANDTLQRLVLTDARSHRSIRLEYQLTNFGKLRDFVLGHTAAQTRLDANAPSIFHRSWINKGLLLFYAALFIFFAYLSHVHFLIGIACLLLVAITQDPLCLVITSEAAVIKYPGWGQTIPLCSISGIELIDVNNSGNVWAAVVIKRKDKKPIKLYRFREGSLALHDALQAAWSLAGGQDRSGIK
jgi:hypothetical protein